MKILKFTRGKSFVYGLLISFLIIIVLSCGERTEAMEDQNIIFLHHSTGRRVWNGKQDFSIAYRIAIRVSPKLAEYFSPGARLPLLFEKYNQEKGTSYNLVEATFPKADPYGWNNYPYDYYNIWVKHQGSVPFLEEPTLEILTKEYNVIMFKHCYPVSNIQDDIGVPDINSDAKRIENYKLQYNALRDKMHEFPDNKFILWTPAVNVKNLISQEEAERTKEFYDWIINEWDLPNDNIYLWDFYYLQTEGDIFFKEQYAGSPNDSHPNADFSEKAVNRLFHRMVSIIENNGLDTKLTGETGSTPN